MCSPQVPLRCPSGAGVREAALTAFDRTCVSDNTHYFVSSDNTVLLTHDIAPPKLRSKFRHSAITEVVISLKNALFGI